jgi:DNA-binding winged helix-turn-helix (wHTH) protein
MRHFAQFRFDDADQSVWRGHLQVPLTRKARHLLACLLQARGKWVSKPEILSSVWPDTHVHPDNIKVLVREIRLALQDDSRNPRFVRSEAGRGYAFVAEISDRPDPSREPDARPPLFMNRTRELAALTEAFEAVCAGSSRVVLVSGERGIGKTAVCNAFVRMAGAATELRTMSARCMGPAGHEEGLAPFLDAIGRLLRREPARFQAALADCAPDLPGRVTQWTSSGRLPVDGAAIAAQLRQALAALSAEAPLVIVLEDLHWADRATLDAFAELSRVPAAAKWLLIGTVCPYEPTDGSEAHMRLASAMLTATPSLVLNLAPLSAAQAARYVDARFGPGNLTDIAPVLHEVTGGHPGMLVAAAESLIANGVVRRWGQRWQRHLRPDVLVDVLPQLLRDVVAQQLGRLNPEEQRILQAASIVGLEFATPVVAMAAESDAERVQKVMALLACRGLVIDQAAEEPGRRASRADTFRFLHPLYAELLSQGAPVALRIRAARYLARKRGAYGRVSAPMLRVHRGRRTG